MPVRLSWQHLDIALKVVATAIACFGVWKYFAERTEAARLDAVNRSLAYISRHSDENIVSAREDLMTFWTEHPKFVAILRKKGKVSHAAYAHFVNLALRPDEDREQLVSALFQTLVLFDEVVFCRESGACDVEILDAYFCRYLTRHANDYGPFYDRLSDEIGATDIDRDLQRFAQDCRERHDVN